MPLMTEWWMLRATSTSASECSSASIRSTIQFEPLEPCTENIVRSAPWARAANASASAKMPVWSTSVPKNPAEIETSEA
jgi:hypothetical protein